MPKNSPTIADFNLRMENYLRRYHPSKYTIKEAGIRIRQGRYIKGAKGYSYPTIRKLVADGYLEVLERDAGGRPKYISEASIRRCHAKHRAHAREWERIHFVDRP